MIAFLGKRISSFLCTATVLVNLIHEVNMIIAFIGKRISSFICTATVLVSLIHEVNMFVLLLFARFSPRKPHPRNEERDARKALFFPQPPAPEASSPAAAATKGEDDNESRFGFHLRNFEHVVTCVLDCTDDRRWVGA